MKTEYRQQMEQKLEQMRQDWIKYNSSLTFSQFVALRGVR